MRRYEHSELTATRSAPPSTTTRPKAKCCCRIGRPAGWSGSVGGWFLNRDFEATGEEALSPPVDQRSFAAISLRRSRSGRTRRCSSAAGSITPAFEPLGGLPNRDFTEWSGSLGLLIQPEAANDNFVIAVSLARAARNPALEELYFFGPHPGNLAFEIGNPDLQSERGFGFDLSVRGRAERFEGELTVFRNDIKHYMFRNPISEEEFHEREEEFDERFGVEEASGRRRTTMVSSRSWSSSAATAP